MSALAELLDERNSKQARTNLRARLWRLEAKRRRKEAETLAMLGWLRWGDVPPGSKADDRPLGSRPRGRMR